MKRRAFTLIELMLAMGVTSLLIVLLANIANTTSNAWQRGEGKAETQSSARGALNLLGRELQGAVVDLDLGFKVDTVTGEPNNFVLRFLSTRTPDVITESSTTGGDSELSTSSVQKIAYQLAWADNKILAEVSETYDEIHPNPVLIRSTSVDLTEVFTVKVNDDPGQWTRWGAFSSGAKVRTGKLIDGTVTEIVAENVLGWRVTPSYWDSTLNRIVSADPILDSGKYYNHYVTSDTAPRALQIRIVTVASRSTPRMSALAGDWARVRGLPDLMDFKQLTSSPFNDLIRQNGELFDSTFYLSSKTP